MNKLLLKINAFTYYYVFKKSSCFSMLLIASQLDSKFFLLIKEIIYFKITFHSISNNLS